LKSQVFKRRLKASVEQVAVTKHRNVTDRRTDGQTVSAITEVCIASNPDAL